MATELVVREPFGLAGKNYDKGQHITDAATIAAVEKARPKFVRQITVPDQAQSSPAATPAPASATSATQAAATTQTGS